MKMIGKKITYRTIYINLDNTGIIAFNVFFRIEWINQSWKTLKNFLRVKVCVVPSRPKNAYIFMSSRSSQGIEPKLSIKFTIIQTTHLLSRHPTRETIVFLATIVSKITIPQPLHFWQVSRAAATHYSNHSNVNRCSILTPSFVTLSSCTGT